MRVAVEVACTCVCVWFELKENTTEKCVSKCNINLTKNKAIVRKTECENCTNNTAKGKQRKCKRNRDLLWSRS